MPLIGRPVVGIEFECTEIGSLGFFPPELAGKNRAPGDVCLGQRTVQLERAVDVFVRNSQGLEA